MSITPNHAVGAVLRQAIYPPCPGAQIAPVGGDPGAICCFARHNESQQLHAITAGHVATYWGTAPPGTAIWQPGANGMGSYILGRLSRIRPRLARWKSPPDCGAIELDDRDFDGVKVLGTNLGFCLSRPDLAPLRGGISVAKVGPSSGLTVGTVSQFAVNIQVQWPNGTHLLKRGFLIRDNSGGQFAAPGDSGSPIFREEDGNLVGMVVAGSSEPQETHDTVGMFIGDVLDALSMDFAP